MMKRTLEAVLQYFCDTVPNFGVLIDLSLFYKGVLWIIRINRLNFYGFVAA